MTLLQAKVLAAEVIEALAVAVQDYDLGVTGELEQGGANLGGDTRAGEVTGQRDRPAEPQGRRAQLRGIPFVIEGDAEIGAAAVRGARERASQRRVVAAVMLGGEWPGDELLDGEGRHPQRRRQPAYRRHDAGVIIRGGMQGEVDLDDMGGEAAVEATQVIEASAALCEYHNVSDVGELAQGILHLGGHAPTGQLSGDRDGAAELKRGGAGLGTRAAHIERDVEVGATTGRCARKCASHLAEVSCCTLACSWPRNELLDGEGSDPQGGRGAGDGEDGGGIAVGGGVLREIHLDRVARGGRGGGSGGARGRLGS